MKWLTPQETDRYQELAEVEARARNQGLDGESDAESLVMVALDGVLEMIDEYPLYSE